jgi:hypothetical protein
MRTAKLIDGKYTLYEDGRVFSHKSDRFLKSGGIKGYRAIFLKEGGKLRSYLLHRLLAKAFIPNPSDKPQVNHINGRKSDNRLENLEWVTSGENNLHALRTGLRIQPVGESCGAARLNSFQVRRMRFIKEIVPKIRNRKLEQLFGCSNANVNSILTRRTWKHI